MWVTFNMFRLFVWISALQSHRWNMVEPPSSELLSKGTSLAQPGTSAHVSVQSPPVPRFSLELARARSVGGGAMAIEGVLGIATGWALSEAQRQLSGGAAARFCGCWVYCLGGCVAKERMITSSQIVLCKIQYIKIP